LDILALIPARGGSKGIPNKNLAELAGKPLLAYAIEAANESRHRPRTVVSTDSDTIAGVAAELGAEVVHRPAALAADETPMRDVVDHALRALGRFDVLVLLQPTSPLRRAEHVDEALQLLLDSGADSVVSVVEVPHRYRPDSLMALDDGRLVPLGASARRRQDKALVYARNGPAILALRPDRISEDLYGGDCRPYVMSPEESVDVDEPFDLQLAEFLAARR
jgi:CMP-N,N'-diacetyllegionaminic acid synthase